MVELSDDVAIQCNNCGEIIYIQREMYDPSVKWYERSMGTESIYSIYDTLDCPNCANEISFKLIASTYAYDIHNERPEIEGGRFLERPLMQLIEENDGWGFYRRAYDRATYAQRLVLDSALNRDYMYSLLPREFEVMVEQIFIDKGFSTELTPITRDGGKDIIAERHIGTRLPIVIYIECKRFGPNDPVGVPVIRSLYGTMTDAHINRGILVTSSYFSDKAESFAQRQGVLIELVDGDLLYKMIQTNANRYYNSLIE